MDERSGQDRAGARRGSVPGSHHVGIRCPEGMTGWKSFWRFPISLPPPSGLANAPPAPGLMHLHPCVMSADTPSWRGDACPGLTPSPPPLVPGRAAMSVSGLDHSIRDCISQRQAIDRQGVQLPNRGIISQK